MSFKQTNLKTKLLGVPAVLAAIISLAINVMPVRTRVISPDDQHTVAKISELTGWLKTDCKKMTLADFHLENDPPHLRAISRKLAEECIDGK